MAGKRIYKNRVKIGNWNEELILEEDKMKEYLKKKEKGDLPIQKVDLLEENIWKPVNLSMTNDGLLHFGDVVMLVNMGGENRECTAVSINVDIDNLTKTPSPGIQAPCEVSAGRNIQPCTRTAFIITSVDGSPEGSTLHFGQSFSLKTTSGFAMGLYLTSDRQSFEKYAKKSRLQEVNLEESCSFLSWWKIIYLDPLTRLEQEGQPVTANVKVLIVHSKTNRALAVLEDQVLCTRYGKEYEVTAHTFLDSHKAERDKNHWVLCTSDPAGSALLNHQPPAAVSDMEPTEQSQSSYSNAE